ncbi:hypothetical protein GOBAR_AA02086 [Gossypium barbadense]|uniref:Uncharacterized protein n=1 Tax=Gossypium barbadense TaxID=3634 RepID=A0A2P5YSI0_GOSBA|nr:hypothetical protein GOBAR_AA02086 [Gossypium barbadense]
MTRNRQDELNTSPNQLKVGGKVPLAGADPRITTPEPKEEIPLTVLSIFRYGTVEVIHPKFGTFKLIVGMRSVNFSHHLDHAEERAFQSTRPGTQACLRPCSHHRRRHGHAIPPCENREKNFPNTGCDKLPRPCDMALGETAKTTHACALETVVETENVTWVCDKEKSLTLAAATLHALPYARTLSSSHGKKTDVPASKKRKRSALSSGLTAEIRHPDLIPASATYDPSRSKALALPPSLRYLQAILAHTLTGRRESTGVVTTHNTNFLWSMVKGHVLDLAYFIALAIRHQTERYRRGGISSMLSMRMIEKRLGTYPPQYHLVQFIEEKDPEDNADDVPPRHEDPPSQPPPPLI